MSNVWGWVITVGLGLIIVFLYRLPYVWQDKLLENRKNEHSSDLQRESFFKQISGEEQEKVFDEWTRQITYMGEDHGTDELMNLVHRTVLFGSDRTVAYISSMMQYVFTHPDKDDQENPLTYDKDHDNMLPMYSACIISSLKKDFSGYDVSPLQIIQLKISDYSEFESSYQRCIRCINKDVDSRLSE